MVFEVLGHNSINCKVTNLAASNNTFISPKLKLFDKILFCPTLMYKRG